MRRGHQRKFSGLNHWSSVRRDVLRERFIGNSRSSRRPSGNSTVLKIIMTGLELEDFTFLFPTDFPLTSSGFEFSLSGLASPDGETFSTLAVASLVVPSRFRPVTWSAADAGSAACRSFGGAADAGGLVETGTWESSGPRFRSRNA